MQTVIEGTYADGTYATTNRVLKKFSSVGSFGVLLHEVVSGVRPKLRSPMEPLRRVAGMLPAAWLKRLPILMGQGIANLTYVWCLTDCTAIQLCYR